MKVLIDTNIILDSLLEREPFVEDADALFEAIENEQIEGYVTATTLTNIFYIVRRQTRSLDHARQAIAETLALMKVSAVDRHVWEIAFASNLRDFEDAVQLACALSDNLEAIVTRDAGDFVDATLPILSPKELLKRLGDKINRTDTLRQRNRVFGRIYESKPRIIEKTRFLATRASAFKETGFLAESTNQNQELSKKPGFWPPARQPSKKPGFWPNLRIKTKNYRKNPVFSPVCQL